MSDPRELASMLEGHLVPAEGWASCGCPKEALDLALQETRQGVPTGIARHPDGRWFVIQTSGQGPYILWAETPSMGCLVREHFCPLCKGLVEDCDHVREVRGRLADEVEADLFKFHGIRVGSPDEG